MSFILAFLPFVFIFIVTLMTNLPYLNILNSEHRIQLKANKTSSGLKTIVNFKMIKYWIRTNQIQ